MCVFASIYIILESDFEVMYRCRGNYLWLLDVDSIW